MSLLCPVSTRQVDEVTVRLTALLVVGVAVAGLFTLTPYLLALLAADFLVRGFLRPAWSPLGTLARLLRTRLNLAPRPLNAGPKIFAARLGFLMSATAAICWHLAVDPAVQALLAVLAGCAALEALAGVCLGCHVYTVLLRATGGSLLLTRR